jgi:hypothetical protein
MMGQNTKQACKSCGAEIIWVKTEAGKAIPLDAEPTEGGNIIVQVLGPDREIAHVETAVEKVERHNCPIPAGRVAFVSHFATCPQANAWRKRKENRA